MEIEAKKFDCVEMKRKAQERLIQEYESRKNEFKSYPDFLRAKAQESEWVRKQRQRFRHI